MDLDSEKVIEVLNNVFGYEIIELLNMHCIKMDWLNAFIFSSVTGANYLNNCIYPFTVKGTTKVLMNAFSYKLVTGIYDNDNLLYSPNELKKNHPEVFCGDKYIIPIECDNEKHFSELVSNIMTKAHKSNFNCYDILVLRIEKWKKGYGMESFLEYVACEYYKRNGYLVENQVPLVADVGSPDFAAYKLEVDSDLKIGMYYIELAMLKITKNKDLLNKFRISNTIVGEAKTATTEMQKQLSKYMNTTLFDKGYELHPYKQKPSKMSFGLINLIDCKNFKVHEPTEDYIFETEEHVLDKMEYKKWIMNYMKFYLIASLDFKDICELIEYEYKKKYSQKLLIDYLLEKDYIDLSKIIAGRV